MRDPVRNELGFCRGRRRSGGLASSISQTNLGLCPVPRYGVREKCPLVFQACGKAFDNALLVVYEGMKRGGVQLSTFLGLYGKVVCLVCDSADIALVQQNSQDLAMASTAVCRLMNDSRLGAAMLGTKLDQISAKLYGSKVNALVEAFIQLKSIGEAEVAKFTEQCGALAGGTNAQSKVVRGRTIKLQFLGAEVEVVASDLPTCAARPSCACIVPSKRWLGRTSAAP